MWVNQVRTGKFFATVILIGCICGCGGGSSSSEAPTGSSDISALLLSPVRAVYSNSFRPAIFVDWQRGFAHPPPGVLEYHIFRDGELVGTGNSNTGGFVDYDRNGGTSFSYKSLEIIDGVASLVPRTQVLTPLTFGVPHTYRVNILFKKADGTIIETLVGISDPVTAPELNSQSTD